MLLIIKGLFSIICLQDRQFAQRASVSSTETVFRVVVTVVQVLELSSLSATPMDGTDYCR